MVHRLSFVLLSLLLSLLSGCALWSAPEACLQGPPLLPPSSWPGQRQGVELLQFERGEQNWQWTVIWKQDAQALELRALNPLGIEMLRLRQQEEQIGMQGLATLGESTEDPQQAARRILGDFQLGHWPLNTLQAAWANSPWTVQQTPTGRRADCAGRPQIELRDEPGGGWSLRHLQAAYRLQLRPLSGPESTKERHEH